MKTESIGTFDEVTLERMKTCTQAAFPLCLEGALVTIFGNNGKRLLDLYLNTQRESTEPFVSSPSDVWKIYGKYMASFALKLGNDVAQELEFETLKKMESMMCPMCPLHMFVKEKLALPKS